MPNVGFTSRVLCDVIKGLVIKLTALGRLEQAVRARRDITHVVLSYVHKVSHKLRKVVNRFRLPVVFSAPNLLCYVKEQTDKKSQGGGMSVHPTSCH